MQFIQFKTEYTNLIINGDDGCIRFITTQITYSYSYESGSPDFDLGSKEENEKELKRFESGELLNLCIKVTAQALGETGSDYLGQCFVSSKNTDKEALACAIEHDMKNNACIELKLNILFQYKTLKEALGVA